MLCPTLPTVAWTSPVTKTLSTVVWNSQSLESNTWRWKQRGELRSVWAACDPALENRTLARPKAEDDIRMQMLRLCQNLLWIGQSLGFMSIWKAREKGLKSVLKDDYPLDSMSHRSRPLCILHPYPWCSLLMFSLRGITWKKNLKKSFIFLLWKLAIACSSIIRRINKLHEFSSFIKCLID